MPKHNKNSKHNWWLEFAFWFFLVVAFFNLTLLSFFDFVGALGVSIISLVLVGTFFYLGIWKPEKNKKKESTKFWISLILVFILLVLYVGGLSFYLIHQFGHAHYTRLNSLNDVLNSSNITNGSMLFTDGYSFRPPAGYHYVQNTVMGHTLFENLKADYIFANKTKKAIIMIFSFPASTYGGCQGASSHLTSSFKSGMETGIIESGGDYSVELKKINYPYAQYPVNAYDIQLYENNTSVFMGTLVFFCDENKDLGVMLIRFGLPTSGNQNDFYSMVNSFRFAG